LLIDAHALVDRIYANGYQINGQELTTDFLGGLFSLDGIHPTNSGYGVIANYFIDAMNQSFANQHTRCRHCRDCRRGSAGLFRQVRSRFKIRSRGPSSERLRCAASDRGAHVLARSAKQKNNLDEQDHHHHHFEKKRALLVKLIHHRFI